MMKIHCKVSEFHVVPAHTRDLMGAVPVKSPHCPAHLIPSSHVEAMLPNLVSVTLCSLASPEHPLEHLRMGMSYR